MTKTFSMVRHKNSMLYWRFHFENETPINCFFTQRKWAYILHSGPWRWNAINMGFVDKWPSRMQGQWFIWSQAGGRAFSVGSRKTEFYRWVVDWLPLPKSTFPEKLVGGVECPPYEVTLGGHESTLELVIVNKYDGDEGWWSKGSYSLIRQLYNHHISILGYNNIL